MATQDMVDFHCELFDRCINNCDDKEDDNDQKDFEMSKDALDVADSVKMVSSQLSVAILTQAISKTKNVCMNYFFNIFSKSQEIRGWRFKTTNQKSA